MRGWGALALTAVVLGVLAGMPMTPLAGAAPVAAIDWPTLFFERVLQNAAAPNQLTSITNAGDGSRRLYYTEKNGVIKFFVPGLTGPTTFLDIQSIVISQDGRGPNTGHYEQGLFSIAFPPEYRTKRYAYVMYTRYYGAGDARNGDIVVSRFSLLSGRDDALDPASRIDILVVEKPPLPGTVPADELGVNPTGCNFGSVGGMRAGGHNGGGLGFSPRDGYLYIGIGDGNCDGANGSGLTRTNYARYLAADLAGNRRLLGKLLRIDSEAPAAQHSPGKNYRIPPDNPTLGGRVTEIWAYGLRNPWRVTFDRLTHDLYLGDVGHNEWEEIDFQAAASSGGQDYGWSCYEGPSTTLFRTDILCPPVGSTTAPVASYPHPTPSTGNCPPSAGTQGCGYSVTGGYVFRGTGSPRMLGMYFYADALEPGRMWGLTRAGGTWTSQLLATTSLSITSFGEDECGTLYFTVYDNFGDIYRMYEQGSPPPACVNAQRVPVAFRTLGGGW